MDNVTLPEIKEALLKIEKRRDKVYKIRNNKLYNKVNKNYKNLPWCKETYTKNDLIDSIDNIPFPVWRKMREYGWLKFQQTSPRTNDGYYKKSNIEQIFLLQELMCQMDDDFWQPYDITRNKKFPWRPEYVQFRFNSAYVGDIYICSIPKSKLEKAKLVTEWLHKKEFLFDEDNPFFKGFTKTRKFIEKNIFNGKVEKWDFYLQRFLNEKR